MISRLYVRSYYLGFCVSSSHEIRQSTVSQDAPLATALAALRLTRMMKQAQNQTIQNAPLSFGPLSPGLRHKCCLLAANDKGE